MKKIEVVDILFGMNDTEHFVNEAISCQNRDKKVSEIISNTEKKRKWSILNPGFWIGVAHCYLGALKELSNNSFDYPTLPDIKILKEGSLHQCKHDKDFVRRLRNSISHHTYHILEDELVSDDSRFSFIFKDYNPGNNKDFIEFEIPVIGFINFVSKCGTELLNSKWDIIS